MAVGTLGHLGPRVFYVDKRCRGRRFYDFLLHWFVDLFYYSNA
jgi:hypothetical protein